MAKGWFFFSKLGRADDIDSRDWEEGLCLEMGV